MLKGNLIIVNKLLQREKMLGTKWFCVPASKNITKTVQKLKPDKLKLEINSKLLVTRLVNHWKKLAKAVVLSPFSDAFKSAWNIFLKGLCGIKQLIGLSSDVPKWHAISID